MFESLHICISLETLTEVREFNKRNGEGLSKKRRCPSNRKAKRGIMAHQVLNGGLQSWVKEKPQGVLSNKTF